MKDLAFHKAVKSQSKLRLAIFGPSGAGKTFSALRLATGIGGPIAIIDTERGSASKYAGRFEFDVLELPKRDIDTYIQAINAAQMAKYPVLIIDSLTHAWHELLEEVEKIARAKFGGNTWSAWSEGTPRQRRLIDALLDYDGHIIATMRTKTEWSITTDNKGRVKPTRMGLAPEQGKGIEYEFDLLMELSAEHVATIIKDRTSKFQDRLFDQPGEDLGVELIQWLSEGKATKPKEMDILEDETREVRQTAKQAPKPSNGGSIVDIYQTVVDTKLSENIHAAKSTLQKYCQTGFDTQEKAVAWMKLYRGWRDKDNTPEQAAKEANAGNIPH